MLLKVNVIPAELSVLEAMLAALRCDEMNPMEVTDPTPVDDVTSEDITSDDIWSGRFVSFSRSFDLSDIEPSWAIIERPPKVKQNEIKNLVSNKFKIFTLRTVWTNLGR